MTAIGFRYGGVLRCAVIGATVTLTLAVLGPARADAFGTFSNGVLKVEGGEGKIVPRCENNGEITVSGLPSTTAPPTAAT